MDALYIFIFDYDCSFFMLTLLDKWHHPPSITAVNHHHFFLSAPPRQCIDLYFDEKYSIEPSWECKFDHIEVRDGPFGFSPIIGRYCGQQNPPYIRSSGRYLWIKFVADGELEAIGFSASYNFTAGIIFCFNATYQPSLWTVMLQLNSQRRFWVSIAVLIVKYCFPAWLIIMPMSWMIWRCLLLF